LIQDIGKKGKVKGIVREIESEMKLPNLDDELDLDEDYFNMDDEYA
jgi:hypothetical protein